MTFMDDIDNAVLLRQDLELVYKHALQGVNDPRFAKDQCREIAEILAPLIGKAERK